MKVFSKNKSSDQTVYDDDPTDVSLFVGKNEIRCHKLILTSESNVFRKHSNVTCGKVL